MRYNQMPDRNESAPRIPSKWQERLTKLLGLTPDGRPKLRLVWGQEVTHFYFERERLKYIRSRQPVFTGWQERARDEATGEMVIVNRYPPTLEPPTVPDDHLLESLGQMETIGIDRWFIELWRGPRIASGGHSVQSWNREHRYKYLYDPAKGIYRQIDIHGEYPHQGQYVKSPYHWPWMIARHCKRKSCCDEREAQGYVCLGEHRAPQQRDVDYIAFLIEEKNKEPYLSGYDEVAPEQAVRQQIVDAFWQESKAEEKRDEEDQFNFNQLRRRLEKQPIYFDIRRNV